MSSAPLARCGDGTPEAVTLLDYLLPAAADMPPVELLETGTANPNVPFGSKGAGEAGCIGTLPAIVNAVCDALDVEHIDMPLTPEVVWRAMHALPASRPGRRRPRCRPPASPVGMRPPAR